MDECLTDDIKHALIKKLKTYNATDIIHEIEKIPTCTEKEKGKRRRSAYQEYISGCMRQHRDEYVGKPFGAAGQTMKKCANEWKKEKKQ